MAIYNVYFSVPDRELIAFLQIDENGEKVTLERFDGEWEPLPPEDSDSFDYTLVDTIDENKLDEFLEVFDRAFEDGDALLQSDVAPFIKKREKPE